MNRSIVIGASFFVTVGVFVRAVVVGAVVVGVVVAGVVVVGAVGVGVVVDDCSPVGGFIRMLSHLSPRDWIMLC